MICALEAVVFVCESNTQPAATKIAIIPESSSAAMDLRSTSDRKNSPPLV